MGKSIVIEKSGVAQNLTIDKIRTRTVEGGYVDWVPEDEVQLSSLTATANGTYMPSGTVYGFLTVTVSVQAAAVEGYMDGVHYVVTLDSDGNLVFTPD